MDDDIELDVLLATLFCLIAQMFREINIIILLVSYGFLKLRVQSRNRQIEKLHFLVGHDDETCRDHIRMNKDCFNRLCYLLRSLRGLRDTRYVSISEQVAIFLTVLSHHTKNRVIKHSFQRSGYTISKHFILVLNTLLKLYKRLLIIPEPVPEDSNDYRWKYFKSIIGYPMEGSTDAIRGGRGRKRVGATTCRVDVFTKSLKNKAFPFYSQWVDIFGNDRANG
ncbi:hypothetical protein ACS0TY_033770 [Phlomoides rotata]